MKRLYQWMRACWQRVRRHASPVRAMTSSGGAAQTGAAAVQTDGAAQATGVAAAQTDAAAQETGVAAPQPDAAAPQPDAAAPQPDAAPPPTNAAAAQPDAALASPDVRRSSPEPDASAPATPPAFDEGGCLSALWRLFLPLQPVSLDEPARRRFSGLLFVGAISFVEQVADAVERAPHLWPRRSAAELRERQARAHFWFLLHRTLVYMTELASDSYLHAQGTLIADAMDVVHAQRLAEEGARLAQRDQPAPAPLREGRVALAGALLVLAQRDGRKRRQRQRARRERGQAPLQRSTGAAAKVASTPAASPAGVRQRLLGRLVGERP